MTLQDKLTAMREDLETTEWNIKQCVVELKEAEKRCELEDLSLRYHTRLVKSLNRSLNAASVIQDAEKAMDKAKGRWGAAVASRRTLKNDLKLLHEKRDVLRHDIKDAEKQLRMIRKTNSEHEVAARKRWAKAEDDRQLAGLLEARKAHRRAET